MKPSVIIIIFLFHETLLNDDRKYIGYNTSWNEYIAVKVKLCYKGVYLDHIVVSVPDHVSVHKGKEGVAWDWEVCESSTFPENRHA